MNLLTYNPNADADESIRCFFERRVGRARTGPQNFIAVIRSGRFVAKRASDARLRLQIRACGVL
jgi:hypothetical protein